MEQTKEYGQFKLSKYNRDIHEGHVNSLVSSMKQKDFSEANPIIVTKNGSSKYTIVDGQHRYFAWQKLSLPVYYIVTDDCTQEDLIKLNITNKTWSREDYIKSYAAQGNEYCQKLLDHMELYGVKSSPLLHLIYGDSGYWSKCTKEGMAKFQYPEGKQKYVKEFFGELDLFNDFVPYKTYRFIRAYHYFRHLDEFSSKRMEAQYTNHNTMLQKQASWTKYVINLKRVYNYYQNKSAWIRIDYEDLEPET